MKIIFTLIAALLPLGLAQPQPIPAHVRVAHLSPNAEDVSVTLSSTAEGQQQLAPGPLSNLSYRGSLVT